MRMRIALVGTLVSLVTGCTAASVDVSPNDADDLPYHHISSAGVIYQLAGNQDALYAVSLDAGVWRRKRGGWWAQLPNSSILTASLAVDPINPRHLMSGDRNGDASQGVNDQARFDLAQAGVWESVDGGDNWTWSLTPLTRLTTPLAPVACNGLQSQAIPAVAFTPTGTMLAGTPCGIARRTSGASSWSYAESPGGIGLVTAFAVSRITPAQAVLWALARRLDNSGFVILTSIDDANSWTTFSIPSLVDGLGIVQALNSSAVSTGDLFSLGAFDQTAVMVFNPTPRADTSDNRSVLLYFNRLSGSFSSDVLSNANNGTGLGGRRSFHTLPIRPPFAVGNGLRLLFNSGQDILEGTGIDAKGHVVWASVARSDCAGCGDDRHPFHADIWDALPSETDGEMWIATDGGVYRKADGFHSYNDGLHTQHIHSLAVLGHSGKPRLFYATADNDAWFRNEDVASPVWKSYDNLGDVNWVAGNIGSTALAVAVRHEGAATITDFDQPVSGAKHVSDKISIRCSRGLDANGHDICAGTVPGPTEWQVVQSGVGDQLADLVDVVWLARPKLSFNDGGNIVDLASGPLAVALKSAVGDRVLLRNRTFASDPDINESKFGGWTLESGNVPGGSSRVWASGGHASDPATYYVCVCSSPNVPVQLFKQTQRAAAWKEIIPIIVRDGRPVRLEVLRPEPGTIRGPLFVDGVFPDHLAIATTKGPVWSFDGGSTFQLDNVLFALLTNSGQFPLANSFPAGNGADVAHNGRGAQQMYLGDVAFGDGGQLAVASPFTGVFYKGPGLANYWLNPRAALPPVLPTVSSIAFAGTDLYVATEGRSLLLLEGPREAPLASYFEWKRSLVLGGSALAQVKLIRSDGTPVVGASVTGWHVSTAGALGIISTTTGSAGDLALGADVMAGDRLYLRYAGNSSTAGARTSGRR